MSTRSLSSLALVCCLALAGCSDSTEENNVVPNNTNNTNNANNTNNLNNANNTNNVNNTNNANNANNGEIDLTVEALETGGYGVLLQKSTDESGLSAVVMDFENGEVIYETPPEFALATADVSADGSLLAFTGNNGEDPAQVYTVDLPDGDPQPIGIPGDGELLRAFLLDMSEDGSRIVYICLGFGIDSTCMWDEGQVSDLDPNEEFSGASVAEITPDGSTAVIRAGDLIYRVNLDDGSWTELYDFGNPPMAGFPTDTAQGDVSISDDGEVVAFGGNDQSGEGVERAITVLGPGSEMGVVNEPVELSPRGTGVAISPDGTSVAFNIAGNYKWFDVGAEDTVNTLEGEPLNSPYFINNDAIVHYDVDNETDNWEVIYSEFGEEPITIASGPRGGEDVLADIFQMSQ